MTEGKEIVIYAELLEGRFHRSAFELSGLARELADELGGVASAILLGSGIDGLGLELIHYGIDKVYVADYTELQNYQPELYTAVIEQVCREVSPEAIIFGHNLHGIDLAPRISAKFKSGLVTDCMELRIDSSSKKLHMVRPVYGAKANAVFTCNSRPAIATLRSKAVSTPVKNEDRRGGLVPIHVNLEGASHRVRFLTMEKQETSGIKLEDAEVVVSGGRGMKNAENFQQLEELAKLLGGTVAGSRVAIDNKWLPSNKQVGLTGTIVSPRLYIAVGISGATQHLVGCALSQCMVAINNDPEAPIFKRAHYGVIADYQQVIPHVIQMLKESKGK